jgi:hypothetical protein
VGTNSHRFWSSSAAALDSGHFLPTPIPSSSTKTPRSAPFLASIAMTFREPVPQPGHFPETG